MSGGNNSPENILIPVEQARVPFYGHELVAARLPDGRIAAVLRWLCEGMKLDIDGQLQRIRRKTALRDELVKVRVDTPGGPQSMPALLLHGLPGWLYSIDESRVNESARAAVIVFQRECTDVLAEHFARRQPNLTAPPSLIPAEPIARPPAPQTGASPEEWLEFHQAMVRWLEWQRDVEQWRQHVDTRLDEHEQVLRLVPAILERLGPATLTSEHQRTIQNAVKRLHDLSGRAYATIYTELGEHFQVAKYSDIPEARWSEVAAWFRARINATSNKGDAPEQGNLF